MKEYKKRFLCKNYDDHGEICSQCSKCGRTFRHGILVDNSGNEFRYHVDNEIIDKRKD